MADPSDRELLEDLGVAIEAKKKRILIGQDATFMWRANRISPDMAANLIYKGMKDLLPD